MNIEQTSNVIPLIHRGTDGQQGWIYSSNGYTPCIPASTYKDPIKIVVKDKIMTDKLSTRFNPYVNCIRSTIYKQGERNLAENILNGNGYEGVIEVSNSLQQSEYKSNYRIRKLTPKECWRLMGFKDKDIEKVKSVGMSNSSLYKQAGNSIITNCVELLAEHLYNAQYDSEYKCFDENFMQPQKK